MTDTQSTAPVPESATPTTSCPAWCVNDTRMDDTTRERCHPDDFSTWHRGRVAAIAVERPRKITALTVYVEAFDPDVKDGNEEGPEIYIDGDDGSGNACGLTLPLHAAEAVAAAVLALVEEARR